MNDQLDNFIQQNRDDFEMYEPTPGLWDTIGERAQRRAILPQWSKYAMAAMVVFALGFGLGQFSDTDGHLTGNNLVSSQVQIIESEYYYQTKINEQMQQLDPYFQDEPRLQTDIESDFEELDRYCKELKEDLQDNINNEYVIEALIKSYQTKLDILEALHQELTQEYDETPKVNL